MKPDIAIVGGGIGGLALALGLHARGLPCRVYAGAASLIFPAVPRCFAS